MADDEAKLLQEAKKLPWEDRLANKNWKCRNDAYIDLAALCDSITDPKDPRIKEFGQYFKKAVSDANAPAQEKALDALIAWQKAGDADAGRFAKEVCDAIAAKCLTGRTKTVEKALVAFLLWVELEAVEPFMDAMEKAVKNKVAKAVVPAVEAIYEALSGFGIKVVPAKRVLKLLPDLFSHADEKVRAMAKALTVELTRWIGKDAVKKLLFDGLREATQKELEAEIGKVEGQAVPSRRIRSEMDLVPDVVAVEGGNGEAEATGENEGHEGQLQVDEYELCDPVDILTPLSKTNFWEGIGAKKWSERKDAVAELTKLASARRLAPADYNAVTRALKKLITDVNMAVSVEAVQAAGNLASGLRRDFSGGSQLLLPILLEKCKEKRPAVITPIRDTLRSMFKGGCLTFTDMLEDVRVASKNKVPSARSEALLWVAECIESSKPQDLLKIHKDYVPILMESLQDMTPEVRDAAFAALANMAKIVGMRPLERSLEKLDEVRKKKLTEMIAASAPASQPAAANGRASQAPSQGQSQVSNGSAGPSVQTGAARSAAASFMGNKRPALRPVQAAAAGSKGAPAAKAAGGGKKLAPATAVEAPEDVEPGEMSPEVIVERAGALFDAEIMTNLKSAVWKERLEGMTTMKEAIEAWKPQFDANVEILVRLVSLVPGWGEKNVQVLQKVIEVVSLLAQKATKFPKKCVVLCIQGVVEKVGDIKTRLQAGACLTGFAEAVGPQFVFERVYKVISNTKNPKVLSETLTWMGQAVLDFGTAALKLKELIEFCKDPGLASSTAACRTAAIKVLGILHKFTGPDLKGFLGDVKPALMAPIEAELEKNPFEGAPPAPARTIKSEAASTVGEDSSGGDGLPREDISGKLMPTLIENLSSPQWKVRQESLDAVNKIIEEAHKRIQPTGTGEMFGALKGRLNDTNKNLIVMTMATLANLAVAMGPSVEKASRGIMTDVLKCMSDPKKQMRESVIRTLDAWVAVVSLEKLLTYVAAGILDPKVSADGRKEVIEWLTKQVPTATEQPDVTLLMKPVAAGLQDKSSDVRKAAEALLGELIKACGFDMVFKAARSELPSSGFAVMGPALDKVRNSSSSSGIESGEESGASSKSAGSRTGAGGVRNSKAGAVSGAAKGTTARSRTSTVRTSANGAPRSTKQSNLELLDAAAQGQPLFNLRESIKEEREKTVPRGVKMKFEPPGADQIQELEEDMKRFLREDLARRLCGKDFKLQVEGLEMLRKAIPEHVREMEEVLDLLLRWSVLRFCESNTTGLLKVLDFLPELFEALKADNYTLTECEANVFVPCLVEKSGHNIANVKEKMRELMRLLCLICPTSKVFAYVVDGIRSKNNRTRVECVEHIGAMIERYGIGIMGGSKVPLVSVASLTTERDTEIRKAALNTLSVAYEILGDDIWKQVGKLSNAQKGLLEDKFRWKAREMEKRKEGRPGDATAVLQRSREELMEAAEPSQPTCNASPSPSRRPAGNGARFGYSPSNMATALSANVEHVQMLEVPSPQTWDEALNCIVAGDNVEQVVEGMKVVCHELARVIEEQDRQALMDCAADADRLIMMLTVQVTQMFTLSMLPGQSSRPCKYVLNTLMQVFQVTAMGHGVAQEHLKALVAELLLWLLDERVPTTTEDGHNLLKALNVLMLKILDNARPTSALLVLISLLRPADPEHGPSPVLSMSTDDYLGHRGSRFSDLVVRCLIKLTKSLAQRIEEVDLDRLIQSIHEYLQELGLDEIRRRAGADDKPLRMVKTVLHEVCKLVGPAIKGHLSLVPIDAEPPPIVLAYIDLNLQTLAASRMPTPVRISEQASWQEHEAQPQPAEEHKGASGTQISDALRTELRLVFKKIGDKATSAAGLYQLWTMTQQHPEVDIFACLQSASEEMRKYIREGLQQVQQTVAAGGSAGHIHATTPPSAGEAFQHSYPQADEAARSAAVHGSTPRGMGEPGCPHNDESSQAEEFRQKMAHMQALGSSYSSQSSNWDNGPAASNGGTLNMELLRERMRMIQQMGADGGANPAQDLNAQPTTVRGSNEKSPTPATPKAAGRPSGLRARLGQFKGRKAAEPYM